MRMRKLYRNLVRLSLVGPIFCILFAMIPRSDAETRPSCTNLQGLKIIKRPKNPEVLLENTRYIWQCGVLLQKNFYENENLKIIFGAKLILWGIFTSEIQNVTISPDDNLSKSGVFFRSGPYISLSYIYDATKPGHVSISAAHLVFPRRV